MLSAKNARLALKLAVSRKNTGRVTVPVLEMATNYYDWLESRSEKKEEQQL